MDKFDTRAHARSVALPRAFGYRDRVPRLLNALLIVALLATMSGAMTVMAADDTMTCDGGSDDGCPDGAPWGCSSLCTRCPCTSVIVPAAVLSLGALLPSEIPVASVPTEQTHWPAPSLAGVFRPPRAA